ncbi:DUF4386 domain-containing protein [Hymenobacter lutimineralis]|uniref:DUF4386 domain-containing protein n=1 Tax=Hymenobacter lutimineralis TaxID=2606448 RepID=A0A5D6UXY0_9BACT|nr:DUF4386 domain-containing protein [Hymenobacter lutimineralis]TYZ08386.1 DUF4386 domain-containing protein [Hymenobacter lutimineralis]
MTARSFASSPQFYARLGGALYLAIILFGAFAEGFVTSKLVVGGDAVATARHILASPALWRLGVAGNVLLVLFAVPLLWIEYLLLRPVSKSLVLLAVLLNVVSLSVEAVSKVFMLLVLPILSNPEYASAFGPRQLPVLANLALRTHDISFNIALIFFGLTCLVNGYLIRKSGYFPRVLGTLLQVAGLGYLVACFAALFAPALAAILLPGVLVLPLVGESAFCLWLLLKGVDKAQWHEQVNEPAPRAVAAG